MSFLKKLFGKGKAKEVDDEIEIEDGNYIEQEQLHENFDDDETDSIELDEEVDFLEKAVTKEDKPENFEELCDDVKERLDKINETLTKEPENLVELNTVKEKIEKTIDEVEELEVNTTEESYIEVEINDETENDKAEEDEPTEEIDEEKAVKELSKDVVEQQDSEEIILEETQSEEEKKEETSEEKEVISIAVPGQEEVEVETAETETETETIEVEETEVKKSFFEKIKNGMEKTKEVIFSSVEDVLGAFTTIDEELFEELEETLIMADMGVDTSVFIIEELRKIVKKRNITEVEKIKIALKEIIADILDKDVKPIVYKKPTVVLVVGVNGAGKTTTIGKLSYKLKNEGHSIMLAAGDTFRAAAIEQLEVWAERCDVPFIKHEENSDPSAVVYDACKSAKAKETDILIVDTAGRLQNKKNLMEELRKIRRVIDSSYENANVEVLLVLDGTTGQNAVTQAKMFKEVVDVTGLVITKLDGTAKGGSIVSIYNELNIPVRYVGLGETIDDLEEFDSRDFARAIIG